MPQPHRSAPIQVISFDLDDTLWDAKPTLAHAEAVWYQQLGNLCPQLTERYQPGQLRECRRQYTEQHPQLSHDLTETRLGSIKQCLGQLGLDNNAAEQLAQQAFTTFIVARQQVQLFAGVESLLQQLSQRFALVALTNGNADVRQMAIGKFFTLSLSPTDTGCAKPHRQFFAHCCEQMGVRAEQVIHIGDHPLNDVKGAKDAGMTAVWYNDLSRDWPYAWQPDGSVTEVGQLLTLIEQFSA